MASSQPPRVVHATEVNPTRLIVWRYRLFGQALPAALYLLLGSLQIDHFVGMIRDAGGHDFFWIAANPVRQGCYSLFCIIPVAIYVARPLPHARDGSLEARTAALVGTTMLLFVGAYDQSPSLYSAPLWLQDAATAAVVVLTAAEVIGLVFLRLSFSLIPEARHLVTSGPYALVRHPLYAAEIAVALAWVVSAPHLVLVLVMPLFVGVQLLRSHFEEQLLRRTFSEYADYSRRVARLIPFIW